MTGDEAPVAVVIVTWNAERFIVDCLTSVQSLKRAPAEIVVVDNGSTDGTTAIVRAQFANVRLIEMKDNAGFCRANNLGIAQSRAPFVLVLNPDTKLDSGFLEQALPAFEDPSVGIVAGKLLRFDARTLDSAGQELGRSRQPIDRGFGTADDGRFNADGEVFGACGAAALYRRAMLDAIADGPSEYFDESLFAFYEDLDLAWRARRLGWKAVYRHRATGRHARGSAVDAAGPKRFTAWLSRSREVRFLIARNRWLVILRNDSARGLIPNLPFVLVRDAATLCAILATSPGILVRLWRDRAAFSRALSRRRLDAARVRNEVSGGGVR